MKTETNSNGTSFGRRILVWLMVGMVVTPVFFCSTTLLGPFLNVLTGWVLYASFRNNPENPNNVLYLILFLITAFPAFTYLEYFATLAEQVFYPLVLLGPVLLSEFIGLAYLPSPTPPHRERIFIEEQPDETKTLSLPTPDRNRQRELSQSTKVKQRRRS